jgi:hypothetical protein
MTLYAGTIPVEQLKLAMDTRKYLETALAHIEDHNYGIAALLIDKALGLLPADTGEQGIVWPELEARTSA